MMVVPSMLGGCHSPPPSSKASAQAEANVPTIVRQSNGQDLIVFKLSQGKEGSIDTLREVQLPGVLEAMGQVSYNRFLLKFNVESYEFTVFPDGRAIIKGTSEVDKALTLYAKYIGH